jgi:hypothetical protein
LLSFAELLSYRYKLGGKGTLPTAASGSTHFKISKHLLFPLMSASNIEFAGGYSKRAPDFLSLGPSSRQNNLAKDDIIALESPGQHTGVSQHRIEYFPTMFQILL